MLFYRPGDRACAGSSPVEEDLAAADVDRLVEHTGLSKSRATAAMTCLDKGEGVEDAAARAEEERESRPGSSSRGWR